VPSVPPARLSPGRSPDHRTQTPLGIYVHVPFCAARCGYCDFNTYVPDGLGQQSQFIAGAIREIELARAQLGDRPVSTIFIGGGTPTLLGATDLVRLLQAITARFDVVADIEITTEANPESVDGATFATLAEAGFTRASIGMQSAVPHVLATLDRVHTAGRAVQAAREAREAGFAHVSLDLIYGTPGESDVDWERSLEAALSAEPDHVSAYALAVEPGTALAAAVRRGRLPAPDDGVQAHRFAMADDWLSAAGLPWYEIASWAIGPDAHCRHNIGYWRSSDWWGIGPGAHSHVAGVRWWNVRRPAAYAARLTEGRSPAAGSETLTAQQRALEAVMLGLRTREGLELARLSPAGLATAEREVARGRLILTEDRAQLTRTGRLFADAVARDIS
jgi:putative oxygen-independent coproporphyrinogen III oxidase